MKHFSLAMIMALSLTGCASHDDASLSQVMPDIIHVQPATSLNAGDTFSLQPPSGSTLAETNATNAILHGDVFLDDSAFDADKPSMTPIPDPFEPWNRMWFSFNDFFLLNLVKPLYQGYDAIVPDDLQDGLANMLRNLQAPVRIVNSLLQFEFAQAMVEFGRFLVNTTAGGLGLAEIVKPEAALVPINLDTANFSGTLDKWGVGEGVYLVWPVLGPSTLRDTAGFAGDMLSSASFWGSAPIGPVNMWTSYSVETTLHFNSMGTMIKGYEALISSAVEPYSALRDAYVKLRRAQIIHAFPTARPAS